MSMSVDLVAILIQCLVLAFFLGRFTEKINNVEKSNNKVLAKLDSMDNDFFASKDGGKLEQKVDALHDRVDSMDRIILSIKTNFTKEHD